MGTTSHGIRNGDIRFNKWEKRDSGTVLYQHTFFNYFPMFLFIRLLFVLRKVEIVHLTNIFYPLSWWMASWVVFTGKRQRILWSVRGEFDDAALKFSPKRKKLALYLLKKYLKGKVVFHSTSDAETKCIFNHLGEDIKVIQLPNFMILPTKLEMNVTKTILYLGRLHPIKAIDRLIIAFSNIKNKKGFRLVIAGDDRHAYGEELKNLCKEKNILQEVSFLGHVDGEAKEKLLASSYLLILPSHTENFGNVVVEALAQGTPVIASRNTPWAILDQIAEGSWVSNDSDSLQKAIERSINYPTDSYDQMRLDALHLCRETFNMEKNIFQWEKALTQLIQS